MEAKGSAKIMSTIPTPISNISALARQHGVSRTTIRRRIARGWTPPRVEILPPVPPSVHAPSTPWTPGPAILTIIALAIGALALIINGQTGWRFGTTPLASVTFAGLSLAGDLLAIVLPSAAGVLWHARRRVLATAAWMTWSVAATLA